MTPPLPTRRSSDLLTEPLDALRTLVMAGGKRLRPAFCFWGFVGAGGDPDDSIVVDAGAAFELLQAFALVHDDVMDGSATRRGFRRSEEHTSALQSLMRISYAVFCLKNKNQR